MVGWEGGFMPNALFTVASTFKIDMFKIPLLHVVNVTPTNQTASVYCFLSEENKEKLLSGSAAVFALFLHPLGQFELSDIC